MEPREIYFLFVYEREELKRDRGRGKKRERKRTSHWIKIISEYRGPFIGLQKMVHLLILMVSYGNHK